jgi:hypothetical protein
MSTPPPRFTSGIHHLTVDRSTPKPTRNRDIRLAPPHQFIPSGMAAGRGWPSR